MPSRWAFVLPHPLPPRWGSGHGGGAGTQGLRPGLRAAAPSGAGGRPAAAGGSTRPGSALDLEETIGHLVATWWARSSQEWLVQAE